jgi:hypothetical protein
MSKKFLAEMRKIEYNKMIGLITYEQQKEYETDLKIAQILKKEKQTIKTKSKEEVVKKNKYEPSKYMNSQSLNNIYN